MNFIFVSPNFPKIYSHFVKALHDRGVTVLGIGDERYENLNDELKANLTEYCYVSNLANLDWMKNAVSYLKDKYGDIDYIESNNEFWLESDAKLREFINAKNGVRPLELENWKYKSKMKAFFEKAGAKVARYILVSSIDKSLEFVKKVGYPVFAKPDNGVGAAGTFKISNDDELKAFHDKIGNEIYIMEEYIDGYITSFDGVANNNSEVIVSFNETFPTPIDQVVKSDSDLYYYAKMDMPDDFRAMGERVVKSFGIKNRCFHIEFFVLKQDKKGLAKKGDVVAIEVNMRSPGGETPELLCKALSGSYYEIYADTICYNKSDLSRWGERKVAISVNRKNRFHYVHSHDEIYSKYNEFIKDYGKYPPSFRDAMGDEFYIGAFPNLELALEFQKFVSEKN